MSTRWWAPKRASTTPDAVVLALLQPDGDAAGDLGATILAAHRAGAGACESVAKAGLVSPATLIAALATTRAAMADSMVTSIAKSMDSSYAGLLIADLFDDAEKAALSLFNTAISKGVAPPVAASRVGAVFGVPSHALGRYQQMACDPKVNPAALVDAADRSLMGYVAKLVAIEAGEEIAKAAPVALRDDGDDFDPRWHPRGADGKFILGSAKPQILQPHILAQIRAIGGGGQASPQVGPKEAKPPVRQIRRTRKIRRTAEAKPQPKLVANLGFKPAVKLSARANALHQAYAELNPRVLPQAATRKLPYLLTDPEPKARANKDTFYEISRPLVFGNAIHEDNDFHLDLASQAGVQKDPTAAVFKIGWLLQNAGHPQIELAQHKQQLGLRSGSGAPVKSAATHQIDTLAAEAKALAEQSGYVDPKTRFITMKDMLPGTKGPTLQEIKDWKESQRLSNFSGVRTTKTGREEEYRDDMEDDFVQVFPQYIPLGPDINDQNYDASVVVHYQPADESKPRHRPQPAVVEYVLGDSAIGTEEGHGDTDAHMSFTLDPNVAYKIVTPPGVAEGTKDKVLTMWDDERQVVVHRYYLRAVDDAEIDTILGPEQMSKAEVAFAEAAHPRDAFGQWINAQLTAAASAPPAATPEVRSQQTRSIRRTRQTRKVRQVQPEAESTTTGNPSARLDAQLSPAQQLAGSLKSSLTAQGLRAKGMNALPALSESSDYRLLSTEDYNSIDELLSRSDQHTLYGGGEVTLGKLAVERITGHTNFPVDKLSAAMRYSVDYELDQKKNHLVNRAPISAMPHGMLDETNMVSGSFSHQAVSKRVADLFAADDKLAQIEIEIKGNSFYFYGNAVPASPLVLFQVDPDLDENKPVVMTWRGEHRAHDVRAQRGGEEVGLVDVGFTRYEEAETQNVSSPILHIFKITNPVVHRLVVNNQ